MEIYRSIEEEPVDDVDDPDFEGSTQIFRAPHVLSILGSRGGDDRAIRFVKAKSSMNSMELSSHALRAFKLPAEEVLLGSTY